MTDHDDDGITLDPKTTLRLADVLLGEGHMAAILGESPDDASMIPTDQLLQALAEGVGLMPPHGPGLCIIEGPGGEILCLEAVAIPLYVTGFGPQIAEPIGNGEYSPVLFVIDEDGE